MIVNQPPTVWQIQQLLSAETSPQIKYGERYFDKSVSLSLSADLALEISGVRNYNTRSGAEEETAKAQAFRSRAAFELQTREKKHSADRYADAWQLNGEAWKTRNFDYVLAWEQMA